ncbi:MAG: hypothetical protein NTY94_23735 [Alphaproteobacteria bacterium]|nr:hypothetical protein [Alphaproteobacteria bacterium]
MLRELTLEELAFVVGGEGEGNQGDSPSDNTGGVTLGSDIGDVNTSDGSYQVAGLGWFGKMVRDGVAWEGLVWGVQYLGSSIARGLTGKEMSDAELAAAAARQNAIDDAASAYGPRSGGEGMGGGGGG